MEEKKEEREERAKEGIEGNNDRWRIKKKKKSPK